METNHPVEISTEATEHHQHHHPRHDHTSSTERSLENEVIYPKETTFEKHFIPDPIVGESNGSDIEQSSQGNSIHPRHRRMLNRILRYRRHVVYIVIWLLFTG